MAYTCFASFYDSLTQDVSYAQRAEYFEMLIKREMPGAHLLLDLACGTGSLSAEFTRLGFEVIGVDASAEMLSVAASKAPGALLLCQSMEALDLYGTVDATVCALDSLNHITDLDALRRVFYRVAMFTAPQGLFVFDVNTVYKHSAVLGDNTFFYENESCCCVWRNSYTPQQHIVEIGLDFFIPGQDGAYRRQSESFAERAYTQEELAGALAKAGLEVLDVYAGDTLKPPEDTTQRLVYVTRKLPPERGGIGANNRKTLRFRRK